MEKFYICEQKPYGYVQINREVVYEREIDAIKELDKRNNKDDIIMKEVDTKGEIKVFILTDKHKWSPGSIRIIHTLPKLNS